jgi:two-component system response regulator ChvI
VSFSWHLGTAGVTVPRGVLQSKAMAEPEAMLIAIVDDEERLCRTLAQAFQREGFRTCTFPDGLEAWKAFERSLPDLAVLDITMPRLDGLELCRRIRGVSERLPVIFLTSRDEEFDRVLGLSIGADDYLCKPFSLRELVARVRVLFRRAALAQQPGGTPTRGDSPREEGEEPVACGGLRLDPPRLETSWQGVPVRLTVTEFRILAALARDPGVVRTREQLLTAAFPLDAAMSDRTVDTHIKRIRRKLEDADAGFDAIEAVYGLGYRMKAPRA